MPYTPPAASPAASGVSSPRDSRSGSVVSAQQSSPPRSPGPGPGLPRSSSSSYLSKHRRSPSFQGPNSPHVVQYGQASPFVFPASKQQSSSVRQSPPPMSDSSMPAGAITTPPDSTTSSSDDEDTAVRDSDLQELQAAVRRSLPNSGGPGSPDEQEPPNTKDLHVDVPSVKRSESAPNTPAALSPSARKIVHSRSSTETAIQTPPCHSLSTSTSDDSDDEVDYPGGVKPPLLRKKSGELVKPAIRPSSRRKHSSMPGTPTYSKAVHFNDDIEQVRHFLQVDRPIAVSAGGSPVETHEEETEFPFGLQNSKDCEWELRLVNWPRESHERQSSPCRVERIYLAHDQKNLVGVVSVANISFHKSVAIRFTMDHWQTTSEVMADFNNDPTQAQKHDGYDQFCFSITLWDQANLESKSLLLCARYRVSDQEHWDNNQGQNYRVEFAKNTAAKPESQAAPAPSPPALGARPIPRSRQNSAHGRPRPHSVHSFDEDFASSLDPGSMIRFRNKSGDNPVTGTTPPRRQHGSNQAFSKRYDFGASLSQALTQAQASLGDRSGISRRAARELSDTDEPKQPTRAPLTNTAALARTGIQAPANSNADTPRPDVFLATKQHLDSRAYEEFVSKFCFFGTSSKGSPMPKSAPGGLDGAQDDPSPGYFTTNEHSSAPAANGYQMATGRSGLMSPPHLMSGQDRTPSPVPMGMNPRSASPVNFGYPYHSDSRSGMFHSEPHTPTAIHG